MLRVADGAADDAEAAVACMRASEERYSPYILPDLTWDRLWGRGIRVRPARHPACRIYLSLWDGRARHCLSAQVHAFG